ncbi:MAG: hypothetical protein OQK24_03665 [Magnetovibrio sp.]|nr:hypothetical protein [Magnetovibrio sp.]
MSETTKINETQVPDRPQVPRGRIWIVGTLFFIAAVGMYAGTMYRINNYGYVGIGDDQPIKDGAKLHN